MLATFLRHLYIEIPGLPPQAVIRPDGTPGFLDFYATRCCATGSVSLARFCTAAGDDAVTYLVILTSAGRTIIPTTLANDLAGQTALDSAKDLEIVLAQPATLRKIITYFPAVQAELLGRSDRPPTRSGL